MGAWRARLSRLPCGGLIVHVLERARCALHEYLQLLLACTQLHSFHPYQMIDVLDVLLTHREPILEALQLARLRLLLLRGAHR